MYIINNLDKRPIQKYKAEIKFATGENKEFNDVIECIVDERIYRITTIDNNIYTIPIDRVISVNFIKQPL